MRRLAWPAAATLALLLEACSRGPAPPAALDSSADACAECRMAVSDPRLAAQLAAPREVPRFYDDIGCLSDALRKTQPPQGAIAYVADHRTGEWVAASRAIFTRNPTFATPMGSHLIAHADAASREADPAAAGGTPVSAAEIFGPSGPPSGPSGMDPR